MMLPYSCLATQTPAKRCATPKDVSFWVWIWVPLRRFLEQENILAFLIGPRNWWVELDPEHTWIKRRLENVSLALILWLVRDDPIADDFVLYNTPHFDIYSNDFNDGNLRVKYVANNKAAEEFRLSRPASLTVDIPLFVNSKRMQQWK